MAAMGEWRINSWGGTAGEARLKKEELATSLASSVAAWSLADLKADCSPRPLPSRATRAASHGRGYVDGTVQPKKRRRL